MRKWILIFLPLFLWVQSSAAQDVVGCTQLLEDAKEAYSAGMVELVPELLLPCLESGGLTGTPKQEAYKLVINAYLFDYLPEEADSLMNDFVDDFPDYRVEEEDPAEFALLLETHLLAKGIDPEEKPVVVVEKPVETVDERTQPTKTKPVVVRPPVNYGSSMGFQLGASGTFPLLLERYSVGDLAQDEGSFGFEPGFQAGITVNLKLARSIETSFGLGYSRTRFSYSASPLPFTTYIYNESQDRLQLPASMIFILNPQSGRTGVYIRLGIMADYLLAASGAGTRSYTESLPDVVVEKTMITDSRTRLNLHGMTGIGLRFPLSKSFVFIETRLTSGLFLTNRKENRYENQDITWLIYHVDSDFKILQLGFSAGIAWKL